MHLQHTVDQETIKNTRNSDLLGFWKSPLLHFNSKNSYNHTAMNTKTETEFDPAYFRQLFGEDQATWSAFVAVSLKAFQNAKAELSHATQAGDIATISKVRHSIGPSLTQWGAISLEAALRELTCTKALDSWPSIEKEFDALIQAFDTL